MKAMEPVQASCQIIVLNGIGITVCVSSAVAVLSLLPYINGVMNIDSGDIVQD